LTLAENKTKITRVTEGFNFLGFNVRRYRVSNKKGAKEGQKLLIKLSKNSVKTLKAKIKDEFVKAKGANAQSLIKEINPIITGTANYWLSSVAKETFSDIDDYTWKKTRRWLVRSHALKNWNWRIERYFKPDKTGQSKSKWILTDPVTGNQLKKMSWTPIVRHTLIKHDSSPFDSTLKDYYQQRDIKEFTTNNIKSRQKLAKTQNYVCPMCGMSITDFKEGLEIHHRIPEIHGGSDEYKSLQLVHISCHIDYHKAFPAKGAIPTQAQIMQYRKKIKKMRLAGE
jgi:RNA-directed DNA polymerase